MKVHFYVVPKNGVGIGVTRCGVDGNSTGLEKDVTCRRCRFGILADAFPWAREFLEQLRNPQKNIQPEQIRAYAMAHDDPNLFNSTVSKP